MESAMLFFLAFDDTMEMMPHAERECMSNRRSSAIETNRSFQAGSFPSTRALRIKASVLAVA